MLTTSFSHTTSFSTNYNGKLLLDKFSTIRLHNSSKYYLNAMHLICLNKSQIGVARIVAIKNVCYGHIDDAMAFIDANCNANYLRGMFSKFYNESQFNVNTTFDYVVYSWIEIDLKNYAELMNSRFMRIESEQKQNLFS